MRELLPEYDIRSYSGPLDLLDQLLARRGDDLWSIPIADIVEQYLEVLKSSDERGLDMNLASEFILMAATLLHIKSRMLLPELSPEAKEDGDDPREELFIKLLAYRRLKILARELERRRSDFALSFVKGAETAKRLQIRVEVIEDRLDVEKLMRAIGDLSDRNERRFGDRAKRMRQLLRRERFTVSNKIREISERLREETRIFFHELYPACRCSRAERVSGFLAILELLRENKIRATQSKAFAVILLERGEGLENLEYEISGSGDEGRDGTDGRR